MAIHQDSSHEIPCRFPQVLTLLPPWVHRAFAGVAPEQTAAIEEIRIVQDRPLMARVSKGDLFVTPNGLSPDPAATPRVTVERVTSVLDAVTQSSVHAVEEWMREGFLPLPGGHRVGIVGTARVEGGRVLGFRHVSGFNIRINRPIPGSSHSVVRYVMRPPGTIWSALIASPPACGKTTLLRDLIRVLSYGDPRFGLKAHRVGVADERSEVGGSFRGVPQNDLGPRTDIVDMCPKRLAIPMIVRAMSPDVVATDEIGHPQDATAILDAVGAGVTLLCTAHGASLEELGARPAIRPLLESGLFRRILFLSRREGPGTVEKVVKGGLPK